MKTIKIQGQEFEYKVLTESCESGFSHYYLTKFYQGTESYKRRKYFLFGPIITVTEPRLMFKVWCNIEDHNYTKEEIQQKLFKEMSLLNRKQEIEKGEII